MSLWVLPYVTTTKKQKSPIIPNILYYHFVGSLHSNFSLNLNSLCWRSALPSLSVYLLTIPFPVTPHSSTLAWRIPWMEESGRLQSMGSLRVGHDWATSLSLFTFMHWRRKWQPTPVFLPGESQGEQSLVGCCLWDRTELDMTEAI